MTATQNPSSSLRPLRIVHVEDSARVRASLESELADCGNFVVVAAAASESEARSVLREERYDVALIDIALEHGNGIPLLDFVRQSARESRPDRPLVIVLTNFDLPAVRERCIAAGADHFLDKAHGLGRLREILRAHAAHVCTRREALARAGQGRDAASA